MRLFIAADLDEAARAAVAGALTRLREWSERDRRGSTRGVSWVRAGNLHLTLHFLGDVDAAGLPALERALAPALDVEPARVGLGGWGVFPPRGQPRVIWAGVTSGAEALARAHRELGERLRAAGMTPEARPFSPHLTVGRVKAPSGTHWMRAVAEAPPCPACEWALHACTLYESRLSPAGPEYAERLHIPWGVAPAPAAGPPPEGERAE
jgi:2'-5' RNA ligase